MFDQIKKQVATCFEQLEHSQLFVVDVSPDELFRAYLNCFDDPIIRQEHNCNCCKTFLRNYGNIVAIIDGEVHTLWDFVTGAPYHLVPERLGQIVRSAKIRDIFVSHVAHLGTDQNRQLTESGIRTWTHFHCLLPKHKVIARVLSLDSFRGAARTHAEAFERALFTITLDAADAVLELIDQNSLYRVEEKKHLVKAFREHKVEFGNLEPDTGKHMLYIWTHAEEGYKVWGDVIGELLKDISSGRDLDQAVSAYERMVAPANYRRPTAAITKGMIEEAEKTIKELGIENSLQRRFAVNTDVPVTEVLHVNRSVYPAGDLFAVMKNDVPVDIKQYSKLESVPYHVFEKVILPGVRDIELLLENKHTASFMSLVAPTDPDAPLIFNWDNAISWSYADGLADSVKERIKSQGGSVEGELRVSLDWYNLDDLDLHVVEPSGTRIYFSNQVSSYSGGFLDVDMNAGSGKVARDAVENVIFKDAGRMLEGIYQVRVNNYCKRENIDFGFGIEIECRGETINLGTSKAVADGVTISVANFNWSKDKGITYVENYLDNKAPVSKEIWGLKTNTFHKVNMVMHSPNYWNGAVGNMHTFFIIDKAKNPSTPRGIFNEFLKPELHQHRKVFEVLGSKLKVPESNEQLSGLGFSSTKRAEIILKVTGGTSRVIKVQF